MNPSNLALIDDDPEFTEFLSEYLREKGVAVQVYADSNDLLADADPYRFDFYVVDLMLPGIDGVNLIKVLRRRSNAGVLVVSGRLSSEAFRDVIKAGADMYLSKPVQFEQVLLAIEAVQRRVVPAAPPQGSWTFDRRARQLIAPDGARVELSDTDCALFECFVEAQGEVVSREALRARVGNAPDAEASDALNATIYRLRRRIERSTPIAPPLQSKSRVGYSFKARLAVV